MYCAGPFRKSGTLRGFKPEMVENVQILVNLLLHTIISNTQSGEKN